MEVESLVKSKITDEDTYLIYRGKYDIRKTETGFEIVDLKTNEVLKDKMQTPVKVEEPFKFLHRITQGQSLRVVGNR